MGIHKIVDDKLVQQEAEHNKHMNKVMDNMILEGLTLLGVLVEGIEFVLQYVGVLVEGVGEHLPQVLAEMAVGAAVEVREALAEVLTEVSEVALKNLELDCSFFSLLLNHE